MTDDTLEEKEGRGEREGEREMRADGETFALRLARAALPVGVEVPRSGEGVKVLQRETVPRRVKEGKGVPLGVGESVLTFLAAPDEAVGGARVLLKIALPLAPTERLTKLAVGRTVVVKEALGLGTPCVGEALPEGV